MLNAEGDARPLGKTWESGPKLLKLFKPGIPSPGVVLWLTLGVITPEPMKGASLHISEGSGEGERFGAPATIFSRPSSTTLAL